MIQTFMTEKAKILCLSSKFTNYLKKVSGYKNAVAKEKCFRLKTFSTKKKSISVIGVVYRYCGGTLSGFVTTEPD